MKTRINMFHGNEKDCAPFSRLCLELVMIQKYNVKTLQTYKYDNINRFKSPN